jgi:hypothetical protein
MNGTPAAVGFCVLLLAGCDNARRSDAVLSLGSLVCPDSTALAGARSVSLPDQCPLLIVEVDERRGRVRTIGPADEDTWLDPAVLKKVGDARLPGTLIGATDSAIDRMAPGPNPGTLEPRSDFGLILRNAAGGSDTVFVGDLPPLQPDSFAVGDPEALLNALERSPAYGFLRAPFAPALKSGNDPIRIASVLAKPDPRLTADRNWIFLATADRHWMWRTQGGPVRSADVPFMENSEIESAAAADLDGDSLPELFVQTVTSYGDGRYSTLHILRGEAQKGLQKGAQTWTQKAATQKETTKEPPGLGSIDLEGSSGEEYGSTVEAEWWIRPPLLYHAYAQAGNDGGRENGHDIRIDAYGFTAQGGFAAAEKGGFTVEVFGPMDTQWGARDRCDSLSARWPEARAAGMHTLPRLTSKGIEWQAGVIAPDAKTAERWREWDGSGVILGLPRVFLKGTTPRKGAW